VLQHLCQCGALFEEEIGLFCGRYMEHTGLRYNAVSCSVLQCVAVCRCVLQRIAVGHFPFLREIHGFLDGKHRSQIHGSFMDDVGLVCGA